MIKLHSLLAGIVFILMSKQFIFNRSIGLSKIGRLNKTTLGEKQSLSQDTSCVFL
jgi:hypothetical protein